MPARHHRPIGAIILVVVGSLAAALGVTSVAVAAPDYPTWDEVETARQSATATVAEIARIEHIAVGLAATSVELDRIAMQRSEDYNIARDTLDVATQQADRLRALAREADARAARSSQAAGQVVAQLSRSAGIDLTLTLVLSDGDSDKFLNRLGTMTRLTEQSTAIYDEAIQDLNTAASLGEQADAAEKAKRQRADEADAALATATAAAAEAQARVDEQRNAADQMYEQLASLRGTSADVERGYLEGLAWEAVQNSVKAPPAAPKPAPPVVAPPVTTPKVTAPPVAAPPTSQPTPATPPVSVPPADPTPSPPPVSAPPPPVSQPAPPSTSVASPNSQAVATAIAFANAQLGDPYRLGASGPDEWDCSGLTKTSYAAAGVYIGTHSATNQYSTMAAAGRLLPLDEMVAGDLLFYSTGGSTSGSKYHTTLYIGGGRMIEAPYPGRTVRAVPVRYGDLVPYAGRPTP